MHAPLARHARDGDRPLSRDLVVVACAASAGIHAALVPEHPGFVAAAAVLALLAAAVARSPRTQHLDASIVVLAALVGAYVVAATTGIPYLHPEPEQVTFLGLTTKAIEGSGILAALAAKRAPSNAVPTVRAVPVPLIALVAIFSALAAVAASGHEPHGHPPGHHDVATPPERR